MYEIILKALKTKYSSLGLSLAILTAMAKQLEPTVTEESQVETAVAGVEGLLKTLQPELDAQRNARVEAEKKLKELEEKEKGGGKPNPNPNETGTETEDKDKVPAWAQSIIEGNKKVQEELATYKLADVKKSRLQALSGKLETCNDETFKTIVLKNFERMQFDSDEKFNEYLTDMETDIATANQKVADLSLGSSSIPWASTGVSKDASDAEVDSVIEKLPI